MSFPSTCLICLHLVLDVDGVPPPPPPRRGFVAVTSIDEICAAAH